MAVQDFILSLRTKHASLDAAIAKEDSRKLPDEMRLNGLKREKLRIKDTIQHLQREQARS